MGTELPSQEVVLTAIRSAAGSLGRPPSRSEFKQSSGMTEYQVLKHFPSWREAVRAAGLEPHSTNVPIDPGMLLEDWGEFVRRVRRIPTRDQYRREGTYSVGVFEKKFGPWSSIPAAFREFADGKSDWSDVMALIPVENVRPSVARSIESQSPPRVTPCADGVTGQRHSKLDGRPTYGNPIDFRGLRHEPVNEQGVVFLFGMVARELGYYVEAVQTGFPDCEAKRQVGPNNWQRVRIEFEFVSRNYRDHGHDLAGCDVLVCWRHNWPECPPTIEVLELSSVITSLSASED